MKISTLYDFTNKISNPNVSKIFYKINKLLVNILYPKIVKPVNGVDNSSNIIVSLTTYPARINTVWITIMTILHQTVKPKKILLWLAKEQFPNREKELPSKLLELKPYGLKIKFCDNLYPHKKYYYTMLEHPQATIITVDDDVFYPEYLIETLIKTSKKYPNAICCTWTHRIKLDKMGNIKNYVDWEHGITKMDSPELLAMPVGIGGVLYPPNSLYTCVFDKDQIKSLALMTDDLWLKAMEVLNNTPVMKISKTYYRTYFTLLNTKNNGLHINNIGSNRNDETINKILKQYPQIKRKLMEAQNEFQIKKK